MGIAEFALGIIGNLIAAAIQAGVVYPASSYFAKLKIQRRVELATAEAVEPLLPFLENEKIPEDKQRRLIQTCVDELTPFTQDPTPLFQGSLNGQKIFENLYAEKDFPRVITEDGLREVYTLLFPRIATLLCQIPAAVKDWESEAWSESYRRLDEVANQIRSIFQRVDEIASTPSRVADETLSLVRRSLTQKVGFELDLTGLRADKPISGKFDDFFVHPEIILTFENEDTEETVKVSKPNDSFVHFNKKNNLAIIVGAPGAGKSTWAKWFQRELLTNDWGGIGIRKELRSLSKENFPSIQELIREAAGKPLSEELTTERISNWLDAGQVVFILDGFDEIRPGERDTVFEWIKDLLIASRGTPIIITSRPLTTSHISQLTNKKAPWIIEPFDKSRIVKYISKWYKNTPLISDADKDIDAEFLASSWLSDPTISPLTGNPLLLSTLLMVHHLDGSLPNGRSELYRRYVEGMLGLWDDRRQVSATSIELTLQQKRQILRALALHLFLIQKEQMDEADVLKWLDELLNKMNVKLSGEDVLNALRERTGLIIGPGIYSFSHKSIIEYLVAEIVLQGDQSDSNGNRIDRLLLFEHKDDDRWNTVIFLWAGLASVADVESFIETSFEAGFLSLGSGLLLDQIDKFPHEIMRNLSITILSKDIDHWNRSGVWSVCGPNTEFGADLMVPSFPLRGLSLRAEFDSLIFELINRNAILLPDIHGVKGLFRDLIWMGLIRNIDNLSQWKLSLKEPFPEEGEASDWMFWIAEGNFVTSCFKNQTANIEDLSTVFLETFPAFREQFPIILMSATLSISYLIDNRTIIDIEKLPRIIVLLTQFQTVDQNLLDLTTDWQPGWSHHGNALDLLESFIIEMKKLADEKLIKRNTTYENALTFAARLKNQRHKPPTHDT